MGGKKGLIDSGLPALVFLVVFNFTKDVRQSSYAALGLSLVLTALRLARKETIQHAISGVIGVAICAFEPNGQSGRFLSTRTMDKCDLWRGLSCINSCSLANYWINYWSITRRKLTLAERSRSYQGLYEGNRSMGRHVCGPTPSSISALYLRKCQCTRNSAFDYGLPALYRRSMGHMDRN
jgi:hypothetical protein